MYWKNEPNAPPHFNFIGGIQIVEISKFILKTTFYISHILKKQLEMFSL